MKSFSPALQNHGEQEAAGSAPAGHPLRRLGNGGATGASPQPAWARSPQAAACAYGTARARALLPLPAERNGPGRAAPASPGDTHPRPATPPEAPTRKAIRGHAGQDGGAQAVRGEGGGSSVAAMSAARRCSPPRALAGTAARGAARPRRGLGVEGDRVRRWARPAGWGGQGRAGLTPGLWVVPGAALYR